MNILRPFWNALKILAGLFVLLVVALIGLALYSETDFANAGRIKEQTENYFKIELHSGTKMIAYDTYGWIEEGGDNALLALSPDDCSSIASKMGEEETTRPITAYAKMFKKYGFHPHKVKFLITRNDHRDSTTFALDQESCVLFRQYHWE